jgi:hypothetical protein
MDQKLELTISLTWDQQLDVAVATVEQMLRDELHMAADLGPDDEHQVAVHLQAVLAHITSPETVDDLLAEIAADVVARMELRQ